MNFRSGPMRRFDEFTVVVGSGVVADIVNCNNCVLVDTNWGGTSLGTWLQYIVRKNNATIHAVDAKSVLIQESSGTRSCYNKVPDSQLCTKYTPAAVYHGKAWKDPSAILSAYKNR